MVNPLHIKLSHRRKGGWKEHKSLIDENPARDLSVSGRGRCRRAELCFSFLAVHWLNSVVETLPPVKRHEAEAYSLSSTFLHPWMILPANSKEWFIVHDDSLSCSFSFSSRAARTCSWQLLLPTRKFRPNSRSDWVMEECASSSLPQRVKLGGAHCRWTKKKKKKASSRPAVRGMQRETRIHAPADCRCIFLGARRMKLQVKAPAITRNKSTGINCICMLWWFQVLIIFRFDVCWQKIKSTCSSRSMNFEVVT